MIVRMIIAVGVLLLMCAIMAVLARRLRGVPPTRLLINLLFPFSQLCIVAFLFYYAIAYELPFWMFALVAVVGAVRTGRSRAVQSVGGVREARAVPRACASAGRAVASAGTVFAAFIGGHRRSAPRSRRRRTRASGGGRSAATARGRTGIAGLMKAVGIMDSSCKRSCEHQVSMPSSR